MIIVEKLVNIKASVQSLFMPKKTITLVDLGENDSPMKRAKYLFYSCSIKELCDESFWMEKLVESFILRMKNESEWTEELIESIKDDNLQTLIDSSFKEDRKKIEYKNRCFRIIVNDIIQKKTSLSLQKKEEPNNIPEKHTKGGENEKAGIKKGGDNRSNKKKHTRECI